VTHFRNLALIFLGFLFPASVFCADANRLTYLDEFNPFAPNLNFPKLATPQWIGESGVEAVVILSIDDMSDSKKYEEVLRPILNRLKKIDGRAPISIFCNSPRTDDPQLQTFLNEGVSLEIHTLNHPCPLLAKGNFAAATNTFHGCVDLLNHVPGNKPVAYRMPCCDSLNSLSPRFLAEIFDRVNSASQFLTIDSSVFNITTTNDPSLPRELTVDADGREKFRKYVPFSSYAAFIENYPYPYQIGKTIWEFPCVAPSDWEAQNIFKTNSDPKVVADWKSAIDATIIKQGVFTLVFHPHGWIRNDQIVELIDYAVSKYGNKIKFLNFREAQERLNKNLLADQPLRGDDGRKNGVRLMDLNNDGYMDVAIGNHKIRTTRLWNSAEKKWNETDFPIQLVKEKRGKIADSDARFGIFQTNGFASFIVRDEKFSGAWDFNGTKWIENKSLLNGLEDHGQPVLTRKNETGAGVRLRDIDHDGRCELIVGNDIQNAVFNWSPEEKRWKELPFALPDEVRITDKTGRDLGLRFVDVNGDGFDDIIFSNEKQYSLHLFLNENYVGLPRGWSHKIRSGNRGNHGEIPMIVRGSQFPNNGAWFRNRTLWVQNENTADKPDLVERMSFDQMLELEAPPAKSPQDSLACIKARLGFKVELVASESLVQDPIAFDWGADGKLWVLEMGDYPLGLDGKGAAGGRVRFLEDTNSDGVYDKSTLFLDGLNIPSGIFPWRKGVLILAAPDLFYAEDTDGDGKADLKKVLFTGFNPGNPQHRANGFDYGLDNWLYGANGDSGGEITSVLTGKKINIDGRDFRFRPDTGEFESESGQTQYGRHRDDWGDWFGTNNPNWLWHYLFAEHYIVRNPHLPIRENKKYLANYHDSTRVFAISKEIERFNDPNGLDHVTSGNTPTPYRDELFGADFSTSVFTSEPVHNCVHREVLEQDGTTFKSHRAAGEEQIEFVASSDNWFRPTMTKTGPDGALYIADMYRLVIEHPEWISADRQKRIDLRAGADKGRIYRVLPENTKLRSIPNLEKLNDKQLVAALESPNGWQRDTAQRLLVERQKKSVIKPLQKFVEKNENPKVRMQALCTLDGLNAITPGILTEALADAHPLVRANAIRISEATLRSLDKTYSGALPSNLAFFASKFLGLTDDSDIRVRFQLAFTLGESESAEAARALIKIALRDWQNPQMQIAVMSSAPNHVGEMLATILAEKNPPASLVEQLLGLAVALNDEKVFAKVLNEISKSNGGKFEPWQFSALAGFLDALDRKGKTLSDFHESAETDLKKIIERLEPVFSDARLAIDLNSARGKDKTLVLATCRVLGRGLTQQSEDIAQLGTLLSPKNSTEIQKKALANMAKLKSAKVAEILLANWKTLGPDLKNETLSVLFSRAEWLNALLATIEKGEIPAGQIGTAQQQKLLKHSDGRIKTRAAKLFFANADRQKIVKSYSQAESLRGDSSKGHAIFIQNCSSCHRLHDEGNQVGPDLGMMADKPIADFLLAILDPNQAVEARYINYTATTKNDREISGVISTETSNSVTLKNVSGIEETILRSDLTELKSSGLSLMPEGFENSLNMQAMTDLIAYLKSSAAH
jgi:putative membrane-bound dehydrogenase-like protein